MGALDGKPNLNRELRFNKPDGTIGKVTGPAVDSVKTNGVVIINNFKKVLIPWHHIIDLTYDPADRELDRQLGRL